MTESVTQSNTGGIALCGKPSKRYCVGLRFTVWCIHSKRFWGMGLQVCESPCALRKGKPVVRRGRKAYGPPTCVWEIAGLPNRAAGHQHSALSEGRAQILYVHSKH